MNFWYSRMGVNWRGTLARDWAFVETVQLLCISIHNSKIEKLNWYYIVTIETIVGVNKYKLEHEEDIDVLFIDNTKVRESQVLLVGFFFK